MAEPQVDSLAPIRRRCWQKSRALNSLESVGESMRAALNVIAEAEPDPLTANLDPDWFDRSVHRFEMARFRHPPRAKRSS
jgi:hypothetical protein